MGGNNSVIVFDVTLEKHQRNIKPSFSLAALHPRLPEPSAARPTSRHSSRILAGGSGRVPPKGGQLGSGRLRALRHQQGEGAAADKAHLGQLHGHQDGGRVHGRARKKRPREGDRPPRKRALPRHSAGVRLLAMLSPL